MKSDPQILLTLILSIVSIAMSLSNIVWVSLARWRSSRAQAELNAADISAASSRWSISKDGVVSIDGHEIIDPRKFAMVPAAGEGDGPFKAKGGSAAFDPDAFGKQLADGITKHAAAELSALEADWQRRYPKEGSSPADPSPP